MSSSLGLFGEGIAENFIKSKGYKIVMKNYRCKLGEIDLMLKKRSFSIYRSRNKI